MSDPWHYTRISDIAAPIPNAICLGPFGSSISSDNFVASGVPVVRGVNLSVGRFLDDGFVYISEEKANELARSSAYPGDLVFTYKGTLGQVGIIPEHSRYPRYIVSQSQMKLTCDTRKVDPLFVYYFFRSPEGQHALLANASSTGTPGISQPTTTLKSILLPWPPLHEQRAIASILGSLDDKVELNRRMNATLEEMARAIFRAWFVDFEPVRAKAEGRTPQSVDDATAALFSEDFVVVEGHEIPRGWKIRGLDQIANYRNGLALQNYPPESDSYLPVIKIAQMRTGTTQGADKANARIPVDYIVEDGDVLFSWSGSLALVIWCGGRGALNQHLFKVTSETHPKWFYYLWIQHHLLSFQDIAANKATTMGHIQRHHLSEANVMVPPDNLLSAMSSIMTPIIDASIANAMQSRTLAALRDNLLPKLLSGELRVREAERLAEEQLWSFHHGPKARSSSSTMPNCISAPAKTSTGALP